MNKIPQLILLHTLPLLLIALSVHRIIYCFVDVPMWDQFDELKIIQSYYESGLHYKHFLACQNEHPVVYYRLITIPIALLTHWNLWVEERLILLTTFGGYVLFSLIVRRLNFSLITQFCCYLFIASTTFNLSQYVHFMNIGIPCHIMLAYLSFLLGAYFLFLTPPTRKNFFLGIIFGHIASWSYAPGLLFWFLGSIFLFLDNKNKKAIFFLFLFFIHLIIYFTLLGGYTEGVLHKFLKIDELTKILLFTPYYLSSGFYATDSLAILQYSFGLILLIIYGIFWYRFLTTKKDAETVSHSLLTFCLFLITYIGIIGILLSLSRSINLKNITDLKVQSSYIPHANFVAFVIVIFGFYYLEVKKKKIAISIFRSGIFILVVLVQLKNYKIYHTIMLPLKESFHEAKSALFRGDFSNEIIFNRISAPFPDIYINGREVMKKYKLNCFSE